MLRVYKDKPPVTGGLMGEVRRLQTSDLHDVNVTL